MAEHQPPECYEEEMTDFLNELRESVETNMALAAPYLQNEFPYLSHKEAHEVLNYWMDTF